jgi:hypothetical protein
MSKRRAGIAFLTLIPTLTAAGWNADLQASRTGAFTHAGQVYASSSTLSVTWTPPTDPMNRFVILALSRRSTVRQEVAAGSSGATLENLKAGTTYRIRLRACSDAGCDEFIEADDEATASTEEEYWRIQGTGSSFATASRLAPDGNVGSYAFRYGPWAGPQRDGRIQLYYNPLQMDEKGVKIGEMIAPLADSIEAASSFRGVSGYGLQRVCIPAPGPPGSGPPPPDPACTASGSLAAQLALFQAVPMDSEAGGFVRLYFEAQGFDGRTRILWLDSQDGYIGRDFNAGPASRCDTLADYSAGGGCEPKLALGVDIDGARGNPNLLNARQFKIGYPTQDSWLWNAAPGAFMWFTTEWPNGRCSSFGFNAAYAVWNGEKWQVQYDASGCPRMLPGAQAPMPVHLGGARYKIYFNRHAQPGGPMNPQLAVKPMQMLYADPEFSGDPSVAEFGDWEPLEDAREIHYLWPGGGELDVENESKLDDYMIFAPTPDPKKLIMYSNMSFTGPGGLPFIGSAVLVNP